MKIGFIYRGDPRHRTANRLSMLKNIAAAKRLGNEVVLVIPRAGMSPAQAREALEFALADYGIDENFPLKTIPRPVFFGRGKRSFDLLAAHWARRQGFDLVWSREFQAARYTSAFGLNTIVEHHHPFTARQWKAAKNMLKRQSFKGVAAISEIHRQMLIGRGWPPDKVIAVHSGVDLSQFKTNGKSDNGLRQSLAGPSQPIVLYAGSLYSGKGCEQILLAAKRIQNAKFVCVGGRVNEVRELREQIASLGLTNVELTGYMPHAQIPRYLSAADVLIAPFTSQSRDVSGKVIIPFASPLKIFEYMAAGKPIVTSNIGAIPEVLKHEENGLLVTPGDVDALTGAISRIVDDPALGARLGVAAQKDVRRYSWDERMTRILEFAFGPSVAARDELRNDERTSR